jgi:hypothetical protein
VLQSLTLSSAALAVLALTQTVGATVKPCSVRTSTPALEELLPRVRTALGIAGTDQVALDPAAGCIGVQVRTRGTARLVKLLLRGLDVPVQAVDLRVVETGPVRGT